MKRDVLWENGFQGHLIFKKRRNLQSGKITHFAKAIKLIQRMTLNTRK